MDIPFYVRGQNPGPKLKSEVARDRRKAMIPLGILAGLGVWYGVHMYHDAHPSPDEDPAPTVVQHDPRTNYAVWFDSNSSPRFLQVGDIIAEAYRVTAEPGKTKLGLLEASVRNAMHQDGINPREISSLVSYVNCISSDAPLQQGRDYLGFRVVSTNGMRGVPGANLTMPLPYNEVMDGLRPILDGVKY